MSLLCLDTLFVACTIYITILNETSRIVNYAPRVMLQIVSIMIIIMFVV
jgi:hypothetical protein